MEQAPQQPIFSYHATMNTMENTFAGSTKFVGDSFPETTMKETIELKSSTKDKSVRGFADLYSNEKHNAGVVVHQPHLKAEKFDLESICRY